MRRAPFAAALTLMLAAAPGHAQPSDLEARVRALEERVAALESGAPAGAAGNASAAVRCRRLNVNGSGFMPGTVLTVTVNGATVGTFNDNTYEDLERHMRPGVNRVGLAFAAPGVGGPFGVNAELRCLAPGSASSRDTILSLKPTAGHLAAEAVVELAGG
ncbi:MAG TPA: hypothetical protein VEB68_10105 [Croceibacterium sp.]|nr:hypothetical protein [Croceibacterium sp.]